MKLTPETTQRCSHCGTRSGSVPCLAAISLLSWFIDCRIIWTLVIISPTERAVESSPSVPSNGMNVETSRDPSNISHEDCPYSRFMSHSPPHIPMSSDPPGIARLAGRQFSPAYNDLLRLTFSNTVLISSTSPSPFFCHSSSISTVRVPLLDFECAHYMSAQSFRLYGDSRQVPRAA